MKFSKKENFEKLSIAPLTCHLTICDDMNFLSKMKASFIVKADIVLWVAIKLS